jgi:hypothetical protein
MDEYQLIKLIHKARTGHYNQCTGHNRILPG